MKELINKEFVEIKITDKTDRQQVLNYISNVYPSINKYPIMLIKNKIFLALDYGFKFGFSLDELRSTVAQIANAKITIVCT